MAYPKAYSSNADRLERIAKQIERIESHQDQWEDDAAEFPYQGMDAVPFNLEGHRNRQNQGDREVKESINFLSSLRWDSAGNLVKMSRWGEQIERLVGAMVQQVKRPFSIRTQQISVLCSFIPFVLSIMIASFRFMPNLPAMSLWSKFTWFLGIPIMLAVAGALVGFLIGVMLDTLERQAEGGSLPPSKPFTEEENEVPPSAPGVKSSVSVAVEDLEPNQRVAETVVGPDNTPILLRHTLLKPSHIDLLKEQHIEKIRIETMTYPAEEKLAMAG